MVSTHRSLRSALLLSAASLGLLAGAPALALSGADAIRTATAACLDSAGKRGWRTDLAKVVSSRSLDPDRVEVVFDLTRDGTNTARLTCPYSLSKGVAANFGSAAANLGAGAADATRSAAANASANVAAAASNATSAASDGAAAVGNGAANATAAAGDLGAAVNPGRAWWLLLPLGLGLLSWAALRGARDEAVRGGAAAYRDGAVTTGTTTSRNILVEANAQDGQLEVHERADIATAILRRVRNGERLALTGHRIHDWLEVATGGWVRDIDVRYDRNMVRFS